MRLLLLLSALLTALAGGIGTRAVAHPVQASASALVTVAQPAAAARVTARFVVPGHAVVPPRRLAASMPVVAVAVRPLYAERRRE